MNIPKDEARALVRIDDLKFNYSARSADARWVRLESVPLGNGTEDYPHGDTIQVPVNWLPPQNDISVQIANRILDVIDAGTDEGERFTMLRRGDRQAFEVAKRIINDEEEMGWSDTQIARLIKGWERNNVLALRDYDSPGQRKTRKGLFVNNANRPGQTHA
jgi:hypothetical protein